MSQSIKEKVIESINDAKGLYHRLVLIVGTSGVGKSALLREIAEDYGKKVINVNLEVSAELLQLSARQRVLQLRDVLDKITIDVADLVFLDNIEILFEKDLQQDPLRLLQSLSRNISVVATWNGDKFGGQLTYAEVGHREYRRYDSVDAICVCVLDQKFDGNFNEA